MGGRDVSPTIEDGDSYSENITSQINDKILFQKSRPAITFARYPAQPLAGKTRCISRRNTWAGLPQLIWVSGLVCEVTVTAGPLAGRAGRLAHTSTGKTGRSGLICIEWGTVPLNGYRSTVIMRKKIPQDRRLRIFVDQRKVAMRQCLRPIERVHGESTYFIAPWSLWRHYVQGKQIN